VKALPKLATVDEIIDLFDSIHSRVDLLTVLAPFKLPHGVDDFDKARLTGALVAAAARCWKSRT
jgi:hypothetical protein